MNHWKLDRETIRAALLAPAGADAGGTCLTLGAEGNEAARQRILSGSAYAPMLQSIRRERTRISGETAPGLPYSLFKLYREQGTRREYERPYFERRRRLNTCALLTWLEPEQPSHAQALADEIWLICDEYSWCLPAHIRDPHGELTVDLFAAETAHALAEIVALVGGKLPEPVRERAIREVRRRVFDPYLHNGPWAWETQTHNWSAVCAGTIGIAAIHLMQDRDELAGLLERALSAMSCFMDGYGEDGACLEGFGYWTYGFGYFVYFADLLELATGGAIDLFTLPKIRAIAAFPQVCFLDGIAVANFSDAMPSYRVQPGLLHDLAGKFEGLVVPGADLWADYADDHCSRWGHALRDLLWTAPQAGERTAWPEDSRYMPDAQWLVSRHRGGGWTYAFAAKGGHNAEPHNHNDLGHFILLADGEAVLHDLGCGTYTADYFGAKRYEYACNGSQGHSVPIVNGVLQQPGEAYRARVLRAETGAEADVLELDIAGAYDGSAGVRAWVRRLQWDKRQDQQTPPRLLLTDSYELVAGPTSIVERFVTPGQPQLVADGVYRLAGSRGGAALLLRYDAALLEPSVCEQPFDDHHGRRTVYYELDFRVKRPGERGELSFELQFE